MEVILLERVAKLGQMGEVVRVRDGYARNFLLPSGKALRATKENKGRFESMKAQLEARNLELKSEAAKVGESLQVDGVRLFAEAYKKIMASLQAPPRGKSTIQAVASSCGRHLCLMRVRSS